VAEIGKTANGQMQGSRPKTAWVSSLRAKQISTARRIALKSAIALLGAFGPTLPTQEHRDTHSCPK
jgi:hypothetical protein